MDNKQLVFFIIVILLVILLIYFIWNTSSCTSCEVRNPSIKKYKSETLPSYLRSDHRPFLMAPKHNKTELASLPRNFDSREHWSILGMKPATDQGTCGSCWAFSASGVFGDRVKIASGGNDMTQEDHISQYHLAACMKCDHKNAVCDTVCDGHYMDEVMDYIRKTGVYSFSSIQTNSNLGSDQYFCFQPREGQNARLYKASSTYRVNPYSVNELKDKGKLEYNMQQIMYDIRAFGPVTATIRVYDPLNSKQLLQNLYLYDGTYIYGHPWPSDPKEYDGYHAIGIMGFGVEVIKGEDVPYWIIRNSWGTGWGKDGFGKVRRGKNIAIIESDIWAPKY